MRVKAIRSAVRQTTTFIKSWFKTRNYSQAFATLPFVAVLGCSAAWYLTPEPNLTTTYERARVRATKAGDRQKQKLALTRLIQLRPNDTGYRCALGFHFAEEGKFPLAVQIFQRLAPLNGDSYPAADIALVRLSAEGGNDFRISTSEAIHRLRRVVESDPGHKEANQFLTRAYIACRDPELAEIHLARIADGNPKLMFELALLKGQNGKREEGLRIATNAEARLKNTIASGDDGSENRILWSQMLLVLGRNAEAERILVAGMKREPEAFTGPLAELYRSQAVEKIQASPFYRKQAIRLLGKAFQIQPDNPRIALFLTQLAEDSSGLPDNLVEELSAHWQEAAAKEESTPETLRLASQFCMLEGRKEESVELMRKAAEKDQRYTDSLITQYSKAGMTAQSQSLTVRLAATYESLLEADPNQVVPRIRFARLLIGTGQLDKAEALLRAAPELTNGLKAELGRVLHDRVRDVDPAEHLSTLHEALELSPRNNDVLEQVATLAANPEYGELSRRAILKLTVDGRLPAAIAYAALGTALLNAEEYEQAEEDLRKSTQLAKRNPLGWNNLAVCLIRKANPDPKSAVQCAEIALKLLPDHETLLTTYGEALLAAGAPADAIRVLQRAVGMGKKTEAIHRHLAAAHANLGNDELVERHRAMAEQFDADD